MNDITWKWHLVSASSFFCFRPQQGKGEGQGEEKGEGQREGEGQRKGEGKGEEETQSDE